MNSSVLEMETKAELSKYLIGLCFQLFTTYQYREVLVSILNQKLCTQFPHWPEFVFFAQFKLVVLLGW